MRLLSVRIYVFGLVFMLFSQAWASDTNPINVTQWQMHGTCQSDAQTTRHGADHPTLRIWRDANGDDPQVTSQIIDLPNHEDAWIIAGWLKMQQMIYRDPSFNVALFVQWLDVQHNPTGHEQLAFSSFDVQRQHNLSTRSGATIAFNWTYQQAILTRPDQARALQLSFRFNQGQALAWLTDVTLRPAGVMDQALGQHNAAVQQMPQLRLRDGSCHLDDPNIENMPIFTPYEPMSFTVSPLLGDWKKLAVLLHDADGGLLWSAKFPADDMPVYVLIPQKFTQKNIGQCLTFTAQYQNETSHSQTATLNTGILPPRPINKELQKYATFGMVTSITSTQPRDMAMMKRIGIQWVRHRGVRWRQDSPDQPQDILHSQYVNEMLTLRQAGFIPLIQTFATSAPQWVREPGMVHRGKKPSVNPDAFAKWIAQLGRELPMFTHIKLLNERDRDSRPEYLKHYAQLMQAGYTALKKVRPDSTLSIEGGFTPQITQTLLDAGLYKHADVIDHHLYGNTQLVLDLQQRLKLMRDAGYKQPVIASEFGVVPGSGSPNITSRQIANGMMQNVATWLSIGGRQFYWFIWGTLGTDAFDRQFDNLYMVQRHGSQPQIPFFTYSLLSEHLSDARPIKGPRFEKNVRQMSFKGKHRVDIVWAERGRAAVLCEGMGIGVYTATGKCVSFRPVSEGARIELTEEPLLIVSAVGSSITPIDSLFKNLPGQSLIPDGGILQLPNISIDAKNDVVYPWFPTGWQASSVKRNNQWQVTPAADTPLGNYQFFWQINREKGRGGIVCLIMDQVKLAPSLASRVIADTTSQGSRVNVVLQNKSQTDWQGSVRVIAPPDDGLIPQTQSSNVTVPAGKKVQLPWALQRPLSVNYKKDPIFTIQTRDHAGQLSSTTSRTTFHTIPKAKRGISIDGELQDWDDVPAISLTRANYTPFTHHTDDLPTDDADLSAKVKLQHGRNWIAVAVEVRDDIHLNDKPANQIWAADCVEFTLGIRPDNRAQVAEDYYKIAMALTDHGLVAYGFRSPAGRPWAHGKLKAGKFAARRTDDGRTIYELIIGYGPLRLHDTDGISFALSVNESDHPGKREGTLMLFDGVSRTEDASAHGWFTLQGNTQ